MAQEIHAFITWCCQKTLNHKSGMQMKIIKFHLLTHFADDILWMGTMSNFDSAFGESHHKLLAKKPAQRTQRWKDVFERQMATKQVENLSIKMAYDYLNLKDGTNILVTEQENKCQNIQYIHESKKLYYLERNKKWCECQWPDKVFQQQLKTIAPIW